MKLSERMRMHRAEAFEATLIGNSLFDEWADEVDALEAKLETMEPIYTAASGLAVAIESFEGDDIDEVTRQWLEELLKALAAAQKE